MITAGGGCDAMVAEGGGSGAASGTGNGVPVGPGTASGGPGSNGPTEEGYLLVKVHVPELNVQKCLQFPREQLVWEVKQQCLAALPKELKESFNYGLFCPPANGKAGKFLDEERRLLDYPFNGPVGYLELKYKRRVYKTAELDEKQLRALHSRTNLRRLLEYVTHGHVEKITKMCGKGLDPNFHCPDSGETPLTLAVTVKKPSRVLIALVNGGALLDYRTRDGSTALHRAVEAASLEALSTLLELGASPNYRDAKGLTPLYVTVTTRVDPMLTRTLLHERATIGAQDTQGWQEVHQACRNGLVVHLEHLLSYGADMDARNASGNTPLHVCAVNNQDSCARLLLFRGCRRDALNYANQTAHQVAVIAGNLELAEVIQSFRPEQVVPYREPPRYNPRRRRPSMAPSPSCDALQSASKPPSKPIPTSATTGNLHLGSPPPPPPPPLPPPPPMHPMAQPPPSPSLSNRSMPPYSSASSSLSEASASSASSGQPPADDAVSIITDKSMDDTSDSSGVGTATSDASVALSLPATTVVCLQSYNAALPGHISIKQGDIIEVTGATDCGLLEGTIPGRNNASGLFPAHCVQEVMLRPESAGSSGSVVSVSRRPSGAGSTANSSAAVNTVAVAAAAAAAARVQGRREANNKHFATAPRMRKTTVGETRTVVLHRSRKGFGFVLRGAKAISPVMELELQYADRCPGVQYLDDVDPGGVADLAGLRRGDFLIGINGEDVSTASHEHVVSLIRRSGDLVSMTVVSPSGLGMNGSPGVPNSKSSMAFNVGGAPGTPTARQYSTLPRKMSNSSTMGRSPAPLPPRRDPRTTLSVGRARARSMVAGLEGGGESDDRDGLGTAKSSSAESVSGSMSSCILPSNGGPPRTASIRARPTSSRITATELEELFQRQASGEGTQMVASYFPGLGTTSQPSSPARTPRVYHSVAEMKRSKGKTNTRVRFSIAGITELGLHRDFHSTPDLAARNSGSMNGLCGERVPRGHRSQEDMATLLAGRPVLPPPSHPPPPPPTQSSGNEGGEPMSSFRPSSSAKLYASPEEVKGISFHGRPQVRKAHSLRSPPSARPQLAHQLSDQGPTVNSCTVANNAAHPQGNLVTTVTVGDTQYAQPFRHRRSLSSKSRREIRNRLLSSNSAANLQQVSGPPIPDPDYSLSEGEQSDDGDRAPTDGIGPGGAVVTIGPPPPPAPAQPAEGSGNSNNSGESCSSNSGSGSGSLPHSFSVDEIQKVRTRLKSSKSYPNDFLLGGNEAAGAVDDADNSSSGVSSDQEVSVVVSNSGVTTNTSSSTKSGANVVGTASEAPTLSTGVDRFHHKNVLTSSMTLPPPRVQQQQQQRAASMLTRHAVSLAQLPPPIEADADEREADGLFVPPPPQFGAVPGAEEVLAPPPQFCDNRLVTRVRIVNTIPKGAEPSGQVTGGRLHSQ